jgi:uncharacterized membrane protein
LKLCIQLTKKIIKNRNENDMIESSNKSIIDLDISVNMKQTLDNIWRKALTIEEKSKYYNENVSKIDKSLLTISLLMKFLVNF